MRFPGVPLRRRPWRTGLTVLVLAAGLLAPACGDSDDAGTPETPAEADAATATPAPTETPTPPAPAEGPGEPDPDRMLTHAEVLSVDIGVRVNATEAEAAAVDYIADEFASYGYEVTLDEFAFENRYPPGAVRADDFELDALSLLGTHVGEASGELAFIGRGDEEAYDDVDAHGAVVAVDRGYVSFGELYEIAASQGAAAVVILNDDEVPVVGDLDREAELPVVSVGTGHRNDLINAQGAEVTVEASGTEADSVNVVAEAPGTESCTVLAGAHHDTVPGSPGGNDNASGIAQVLEIARAVAADEHRPGLCFVTFGAEESGLHGSQHLVTALQDAGELPEAMVNLDVTGMGQVLMAIGSHDLVRRSIDTGSELGVEVTESFLPSNLRSDHVSFEEVGVPVLFFTTGPYDEYHTPADTFDILEPATVNDVGLVAYQTILDLYEGFAAGP